MRIVFMGTPAFAVPSLFALSAAGWDVVAVYSRPDAISGRGAALHAPAVKIAALELGVPVRQPVTLRDPDEIDALAMADADLIVVAAYGVILPPEALVAAHGGVVNVHASLLPRWRGAAPVQRAILAGDEEAGVSIMRVEQGLDTGPFCAQERTTANGKTAVDLTAELGSLGARVLVASLPAIENGTAVWREQDPALVTYANKVSKSDVRIDTTCTAIDAERRIRASMPTSPSRISIRGRGLTLLDATVSELSAAPGTVGSTRAGLLLGVADGAVEVRRVKPDGKSEMDATAWARGVRDIDSGSWETSP